jgi:hypothetical protein
MTGDFLIREVSPGCDPLVPENVLVFEAAVLTGTPVPGVARVSVGDGVNIWPAQTVVGGLNLAILVYECDRDLRTVGETLIRIHDKVRRSKLSSLIAAISTNPSLATGIAISEAVNELMGVIGNIMKRNGDDYVDFFEGSYGTDKPQAARVEKYDHPGLAAIELAFTVS